MVFRYLLIQSSFNQNRLKIVAELKLDKKLKLTLMQRLIDTFTYIHMNKTKNEMEDSTIKKLSQFVFAN